jgi:hypothetical protein
MKTPEAAKSKPSQDRNKRPPERLQEEEQRIQRTHMTRKPRRALPSHARPGISTKFEKGSDQRDGREYDRPSSASGSVLCLASQTSVQTLWGVGSRTPALPTSYREPVHFYHFGLSSFSGHGIDEILPVVDRLSAANIPTVLCGERRAPFLGQPLSATILSVLLSVKQE